MSKIFDYILLAFFTFWAGFMPIYVFFTGSPKFALPLVLIASLVVGIIYAAKTSWLNA